MELTGTIPPRYFIDMDRLREKNLLREAFRDLLPPGSEAEHKHTFTAPAWSTFARTRAGRPLFAELLSAATTRKVGVFRPWTVAVARRVLNWCPLPRALARQGDALLGTILTTHLLHQQFVENRIACDPNFPMVDRSPDQLVGRAVAA